jgi:Zn-finger nucleic acid-binding protein
VKCAHCGAPLPLRSSHCAHCRAAHDADLRVLGRPPVRSGTSERRCPRCAEALVIWGIEVGEAQLELDRCASCAGLFFDPEELEAVLRGSAISAPETDHQRLSELLAETKPDPDRRVRYVPCPVCGALMQRKAYGARSGVVVDRCGRHGLWLDGGELRRLLHWRRAGGELWHDETERELQSEREREERVKARTSREPGHPLAPAGDRPWWIDLVDWLSVLTRLTR